MDLFRFAKTSEEFQLALANKTTSVLHQIVDQNVVLILSVQVIWLVLTTDVSILVLDLAESGPGVQLQIISQFAPAEKE